MVIKTEPMDIETTNGSTTTPPPSKRPRHTPPQTNSTNGDSQDGTLLQDTLSTVIGNLGNLNPDQLQALAGILSDFNGNGDTRRKPSLNCDLCPAVFLSESDYFKHITFSHESDCGICLKSFDNHALLEEHVTKVHKNTEPADNHVICVVCKINFPDGGSLQAHMNTHKQIFKCVLCNELFGEHRALELHLKSLHEDHKPHTCYACAESFCTPSELYKHISFKHDLDCTVCQQPFSSAQELKLHMSEEHVFECCGCAAEGNVKIFNSVQLYDIHLDHFHKGTNFYKCINCKKRYISLSEFQTHVMEAHQAKPASKVASTEDPSQCPICTERCGDDVITHINDKHANICMYCSNVCETADQLSDHVRQTHQRQCGVCSAVFRDEYLVLEHYRDSHSELPPTSCVLCEKVYVSAAEMVSHLKVVHHEALKIPPPLTEWRDSGNLETDVLPCKQCPYKGNSGKDIQKHVKTMHSTRCFLCKRVLSCPRSLDIHILTQHCVHCDMCEKKFSSKILLRNHITTQHPDKEIYTCRICVEHFNSEQELVRHVSAHLSSRRLYACTVCEARFYTKRQLDEHLATEHNKPFFSCDICTHCFVSETALHKHIEIYHENIVFFNCNKCSKKTLSKQELDSHIEQIHKDDYDYTTCDICKELFTNQSDYFKHISFSHDTSSLNSGINKCPYCTASFANESALADHQIKSHQKNKMFVCKLCGVKFTSYYRLGRHMKLEHKGSEFFCDICNKSFHSTLALYRHQKTYHESELGVKICLTCGARLSDQTQLQEHVAQHFTSVELKCKQCNMTFNTVAALNEHNVYHTRQEYRCIDCVKTFSSQTELKVHVSVDHVGMVMCQFCDEAFENEAVLESHVKLQHSGGGTKQNYRCTDCGERFSHSSELKVHVTLKHLGQTRAGDGNPKYNCIDCSDSFLDKQALKAHIASKHAGTTICTNCYRVFTSQEALADHACDTQTTVECSQCSAKFELKSELEDHMVSHISVNVNQQYCTQCNKQFTSVPELELHECKGKDQSAKPLDGTLIGQSPRSSPRPSTSSDKTAGIPALLATLLGPLNTSPEALAGVLAQLPPTKISELISTLTSNQDIISSLATNPPKLPDSLVQDQKRRSSPLPPAPSAAPPLSCPRCKNKFVTKEALVAHIQTCSSPAAPQIKGKPDLKLIHRQLFIAAQNIDVTLLNIQQVETLMQVLSSEDGLKKVPQHKVVDLLDAIEKSVKIKEAKDKEARAKKSALRRLTTGSPSRPKTPHSNAQARRTPSPSNLQDTSPRSCKSGMSGSVSSPRPASLTDCLPPEITTAILPAIKDDKTDHDLLSKISSAMQQCHVTLSEPITAELSSAITRSVQILKYPDNTSKTTLGELKSIIVSILGQNSSSDKSIKQGMLNVLKRNYTSVYLHTAQTSLTDIEQYIHYFVDNVLQTLGDLTPNLLTLPFLLDLVLKNKGAVNKSIT